MADLATAYLRLKVNMQGAQKEIEAGLNGVDTKKSGQKVGKSLGENAKVGLGKIAIGNFLGNALTAGAQAAAQGIGEIVGGSFEQAKAYEQLVGGVDKLFGESSKQVQQYAAEAYKTAGLSANEYMEQATSFSASLISSLGGDTELAANYANEAIKDMSDNVNVFGSDMESVQNAYQGFAKGNFTMLDNLKLGYGGTKEEMQRLLRHAEELNGYMEGSLSIDNYADIIEAIHTVQEEMKISGATEAEAMGTVEGSINATKAAWANFQLALGTGQGIDTAITNLVSSASAAATNIMPLLSTIGASIGTALQGLITQASAYIQANKGTIVQDALNMFGGFVDGLIAVAPQLLQALTELLANLVVTIITHIPEFLAKAGELILAIVTGIANGLAPTMQAMNQVIEGGLNAVGQFFGDMLAAGANLVQGLIEGIQGAIGGVADAIMGGLQGAVDGALSFLGIASPSKLFAQIGSYTMQGFAQGITKTTSTAAKAMHSAVNSVYGAASGSATFTANAQVANASSGLSEAVKAELSGMGVYIDGRALVGKIAPRMDAALGGFN